MEKYYNYKKILRKKADYNIIFGKRSNGKTYGILEHALKNNLRVAYIRRYAEEITPKNIRDLYESHNVYDNRYNAYMYKSKQFKLCHYDENGKADKLSQQTICECFALSTWEHSKGADRGHFDIIVFDEFLTNSNYLHNEFIIFQNLLSSLIRDREKVQIFMLGNSVSKYSPYWEEFAITKEVENIKQGEILTIYRGSKNTKICVEFCANTTNTEKVKKFFEIGNNVKSRMITQGTWEIDTYPRADFPINKDNILYTAYIIDSDIALDVAKSEKNIIIRVRPSTREKKKVVFAYDCETLPNVYVTTSPFNPISKPHKIILECINSNRVVYTSNEIGDKFNAYLRSAKRRENNLLYVL